MIWGKVFWSLYPLKLYSFTCDMEEKKRKGRRFSKPVAFSVDYFKNRKNVTGYMWYFPKNGKYKRGNKPYDWLRVYHFGMGKIKGKFKASSHHCLCRDFENLYVKKGKSKKLYKGV